MEQYTLKELNELIKATLDTHLEPSYWVIAEVGEMRINQKGHCYMELIQKEDDILVAKIRANIWAYTFRNLRGWFETSTGQSLRSGLKILVNVMVQFHEMYGMSLIVRDIDPNFTLGERALKRQQVIDRLKEDGTFDLNKRLQLPLVPQRIAVISSPTAAGYGDFHDQLINNPYGYSFVLKLFKSLMQGEEAPNSIIQSLEMIEERSEEFDVVVITRGGGSQVDLDCFDSYELCSRLASMNLPIITGIGHDRDETIADLVSHTSLKTPTAVSEFLVSGVGQFDVLIDEYHSRLVKETNQIIRFEELKLNESMHRLKQLFHMALKGKEYQLDIIQKNLISASENHLSTMQIQLENLETRISLLDPNQILKRGYTITSFNNKFLSSENKVKKGDKIRTYSNSIIIDSTIDKTEDK